MTNDGQEGGPSAVPGKLSQKTALILLSLPAEQRTYPMGDRNKALRREITKDLTGGQAIHLYKAKYQAKQIRQFALSQAQEKVLPRLRKWKAEPGKYPMPVEQIDEEV